MLESVLQAYNLETGQTEITQFGTGLINHTWKVIKGNREYILQGINQTVFKQPFDIANNLDIIGNHFALHHPHYLFVGPIVSKDGKRMIKNAEGLFRMFPFVNGSHAKEVVETVDQAYEAAVQFGKFTRLTDGIDVQQIKITLPHFHDLTYRYQQFLEALKTGNTERIATSKLLIDYLTQQVDIVNTFKEIKNNPEFKTRIMHHDTKISNILFDKNDKGICVIDLDTVMPGYFFSDVGDMMRTYLSAANEEEKDFTKIEIRDDFYSAIVKGYRSEMKHVLTETENQSFFYAAKFMIYMQALRFLTDHLNNDAYYGAKYEGHNFNRANNQIVLLQRLLEKEEQLTTDNRDGGQK